MKKKLITLFIIGIFLITILSNFGFAANDPLGPLGDLIGSSDSGIIGIVTGVLETLTVAELTIPGIPGGTPITVPLLHLVATFLIMLGILIPASSKITVFDDHPKSKTVFVVGVSLLVMFFSPLPTVIGSAMSYLGILLNLGLILAFIVVIIILFKVTRRTLAKEDIKDGEVLPESHKAKTNIAKAKQEYGHEKKLIHNEEGALGRLEHYSKIDLRKHKHDIHHWHDIKKVLSKASHVNTEQGKQIVSNVINQLSDMVQAESKEHHINVIISRLENGFKLMAKKEDNLYKCDPNNKEQINKITNVNNDIDENEARRYLGNLHKIGAHIKGSLAAISHLLGNAHTGSGEDRKLARYGKKIFELTNQVREQLQSGDQQGIHAAVGIIDDIINTQRHENTIIKRLIKIEKDFDSLLRKVDNNKMERVLSAVE